jgi:hypothetical protein
MHCRGDFRSRVCKMRPTSVQNTLSWPSYQLPLFIIVTRTPTKTGVARNGNAAPLGYPAHLMRCANLVGTKAAVTKDDSL